MKLKFPSTGIVIPSAPHTTLLSQTFEGSPGGMNLAVPQHEIADSEAYYIRDGLVDKPGVTRRRGPMTRLKLADGVTNFPPLALEGCAFVTTLNPQGNARYGVFAGSSINAGFFVPFNDANTAYNTAIPLAMGLPHAPPASPYKLFSIAPALNGGKLIGVSGDYDSSDTTQGLIYWRGANTVDYSTGTLTLVRGSTTVTGAGTAWANGGASSGSFLFANTDDPYSLVYVGVVLSVDSDTSLTLEAASPYTATAKAYQMKSLRGIAPKVLKGRITTDVTTAVVTGGATEFSSEQLGTGVWNIFRTRDMAFVGKVLSVISDTSLTLTANSAVACSDEAYVALRVDADFSQFIDNAPNKVGFVSCVHAERQWYANNGLNYKTTQRLWFSDSSDLEGLDLSTFNGDWLDVASSTTSATPIKALASTQDALLVLKENEAFGVFGTTPAQFSVRKLGDVGVLSGMSVKSWGGGVIWAGREGIYYFDGTAITNLSLDKLGDYWKNVVRTFDPTKYRMYSMLNRDHYILFIENVTSTVPIIQQNVLTYPTSLVVVLNLVSGAFTQFQNVPFRGEVTVPASSGKRVWYLVNDGSSNGFSYICDGEALFNSDGVDFQGPGPYFFYESKKFNAGDSLRLKRFKQLSLYYLAQAVNGGLRGSAALQVDSVVSLNNVGQTLTTTFPQSTMSWDKLRSLVKTWSAVGHQFLTWDGLSQAIFVAKRAKFQKKTQHLSFRIYQNDSQNPSIAGSNFSKVVLGPFQIVYKLARVGRI